MGEGGRGTSSPAPRRSALAPVQDAFTRFFYAPESPWSAIVFRWMLGIWTLAFFSPRLPHLEELYTERAIHLPHPLLEVLGVPMLPLWAVRVVMGSCFLCLLLFIRGWRARAMHLLILAHLAYLMGFDTLLLRGYGELAFYQWLLLWFAPYDRPIAVDGEPVQISRWGTQLLRLQFASVYAFTVAAKLLGGGGWPDGTTLYYALHGQDYGSFLFSSWIDYPLPVTMVLGWAALATEVFIAVGLFLDRTRRLAMWACVGLHLAITLHLRVSVLFPLLMIGHLVLFVKPTAWERLFGGETRS